MKSLKTFIENLENEESKISKFGLSIKTLTETINFLKEYYEDESIERKISIENAYLKGLFQGTRLEVKYVIYKKFGDYISENSKPTHPEIIDVSDIFMKTVMEEFKNNKALGKIWKIKTGMDYED